MRQGRELRRNAACATRQAIRPASAPRRRTQVRTALALLSALALAAAPAPVPAQVASRSEVISPVTVEPDAQGQFRLDAYVVGMDGETRKLRFLVDTGAAAVTIRESDLRDFAYLQEPEPGSGVVYADGRTAG